MEGSAISDTAVAAEEAIAMRGRLLPLIYRVTHHQTPQIAHGKPLSLSLTPKMSDFFERNF